MLLLAEPGVGKDVVESFGRGEGERGLEEGGLRGPRGDIERDVMVVGIGGKRAELADEGGAVREVANGDVGTLGG